MEVISSLKHLKLLYVEDDMILFENTYPVLKYFFDTIYTSHDGQEALELVRLNDFDIALLDIKLPHINGIELARALREKSLHVKILMVSSYQEVDDLVASIRIGVADYIRKPFTLEELRTVLLRCANLEAEKKILTPISVDWSYHWGLKELISVDETTMALTKAECLLLELLLNSHHKMLTYEEISLEVYGEEYQNSMLSAIKNMMYRLRKKTGLSFAQNVSGIGYRVL